MYPRDVISCMDSFLFLYSFLIYFVSLYKNKNRLHVYKWLNTQFIRYTVTFLYFTFTINFRKMIDVRNMVIKAFYR